MPLARRLRGRWYLSHDTVTPTYNQADRYTPDNTNADPETRAHWVRLARRLSVPARCILLRTDARACEHNNAVRALNGRLVCSVQLRSRARNCNPLRA